MLPFTFLGWFWWALSLHFFRKKNLGPLKIHKIDGSRNWRVPFMCRTVEEIPSLCCCCVLFNFGCVPLMCKTHAEALWSFRLRHLCPNYWCRHQFPGILWDNGTLHKSQQISVVTSCKQFWICLVTIVFSMHY